jgi:hypothetical protein
VVGGSGGRREWRSEGVAVGKDWWSEGVVVIGSGGRREWRSKGVVVEGSGSR